MYNAIFWQSTTLVNQSFKSVGEENVGKFTTANIIYFSKSGIWLRKILTSDVVCAQFPKDFPARILAIAIVQWQG